jgi:hypothetical protein
MKTTTIPPAAGEAAHSPLPWSVVPGPHSPRIIAADGWGLGVMTHCGLKYHQEEPNAAFIVRACNSHAALVVALEGLLAGRAPNSSVPAVIKARAALAAATT